MKTARRQSAFSLIEIMVTVTLLSLIVIGLLAVFSHLQGAMRAVNNQSDVFEGARATASLVGRDLVALAPSGQTNVTNFLAYDVAGPTYLARPGGPASGTQDNILQDIFMLSRQNDQWLAVGYFVDRTNQADAVGTLYRFSLETSVNAIVPSARTLLPAFLNADVGQTNVHRVTDGVVHFVVRAFDAKGRSYLLPPNFPPNPANRANQNQMIVRDRHMSFWGESLPAYLEVELGILEPTALRQFKAINAANAQAGRNFLLEQLGKIHLFRQRIPIRNHNKPEAL